MRGSPRPLQIAQHVTDVTEKYDWYGPRYNKRTFGVYESPRAEQNQNVPSEKLQL